MAPGGTHRRPSSRALADRYQPQDLAVFTADERERFVDPIDPALLSRIDSDPKAWDAVARQLAWQLLYRIEPELYGRLTAGERLHPGILAWLPETVARAVEVGAGLGRLTLDLAPRCSALVAVEPAQALRSLLERRLKPLRHDELRVCAGFLDDLPVPNGWAELTVICSAFSCNASNGSDVALAELERVTAPGGLLAIIWPPPERRWFEDRGFAYEEFPGEMAVEFSSLKEALEIAEIFYPKAVDRVTELGDRIVPYEVLGLQAPQSLAWRLAGSTADGS